MPHQNTTSSTATAQNAVTDPAAPSDRPDGAALEPGSYASSDLSGSTLAPPAAGEMRDAMDDGEALDGAEVQHGASNANRLDRTEKQLPQGPKIVAANPETLKGD